MIFKRKVYDKLLEWKELAVGTSAVLLEGARRIGKSTIVDVYPDLYDDVYLSSKAPLKTHNDSSMGFSLREIKYHM